MKSESNDQVFQAYLQSGMARVVVPIRQQFTEAFAFYLESGQIWLGNDLVAGSQNNVSLSIVEELQSITTGPVEDEWETRVPTSLAIIQGRSAFLENEGLPCCHEISDNGLNEIVPSTDVLQNIITVEKP
jgi:hypothetical protein